MTNSYKDVDFSGPDSKSLGQIYGAFKSARIDSETIVEDSISGLDKLAGKWKKHINSNQIKRAFTQRCYELLFDCSSGDNFDIPTSGKISDGIEESILERETRDFWDFLKTLPHTYVVRLKLPNLRFTNPVNERVGDFGLTTELLPRGLLDQHPNVLVIEKEILGFADTTMDSNVISEGMDTMRTVLGLMLVDEQVYINVFRLGQGGIIFSATGAREIKNEYLNAFCADREHRVSFQLPLDLSVLLLSMELKWSRRGEMLHPSIIEIKNCLSKADLLLKNSHRHASSIASACQWLFNSWVGENDTLSFLQVCFGYEALFGEAKKIQANEPSPGITYAVSTKCAFSVAKTVAERDEIIKNFRMLYESRSNIVHGSKSKLNPEDRELFRWGRGMLAKAIQTEFSRL